MATIRVEGCTECGMSRLIAVRKEWQFPDDPQYGRAIDLKEMKAGEHEATERFLRAVAGPVCCCHEKPRPS